METIAGIICIVAIVGVFIWALVCEVKHMKMCTLKAKEEMEFFRSFRKYIESMEEELC